MEISEKTKERLQKMLDKCIEELRLKCFKYKRQPFLSEKVTIETYRFTEPNTVGIYDWDKDTNTHIIKVDFWITAMAFVFHNYRKYNQKRLKSIIIHELIHAFVEERYQWMCEIEDVNSDGSPIFLEILDWVGGETGHNAAQMYYGSEEAQDVKDMDNFKQLDRYCRMQIKGYNNAYRQVKLIATNNKVISNTVIFANQKGIINHISKKNIIIANNNGKLGKAEGYANVFTIGFNVQCWELADKIKARMECTEIFKEHSIEKSYYKGEKLLRNVG